MGVKEANLLSRLRDAGIIEPASENNFVLTNYFESKINKYRSDWETDRVHQELVKILEDREIAHVLHGPADNSNSDCVYVYAALNDFFPNMGELEKCQLSIILTTFIGDLPKDEGSPETFFTVTGDVLPHLVRGYERAIIYIWSNDCEPCDTMQEKLDNIFEDSVDDIGLFSVYGPECANFLYDEYSVIGGPTMLFMSNGGVDVRLMGDKDTLVIESEVEKLREQSKREGSDI